MKKTLFIATVIFVLFILFVLFLFLSNSRRREVAPSPVVLPIPTESQIAPTATPPPLNQEEPLIEQIIDRLPVSTEKYDIEYLSLTNTFVITIKESPFAENSELARQWFLQNGFSSTEGLNILYNSYEWVE